MTRGRFAVLICLAFTAAPETAAAHIPFEGIHSFYNGILHPLLVPAQVLLIVSFGMLLGQRGLHRTQGALIVFALAVLVGLGLSWSHATEGSEVLVLVIAATVGLVVAASPRLPLAVYVLVGVAAGIGIGLDSAQESLAGAERLLALAGCAVGIWFFSIYPIMFAEHAHQRPWQRIAVRIIGSWVAASALLVLALTVSKTGL